MLTRVQHADESIGIRQTAELSLVVVYAADVARSKQFYESLGLAFTAERHGKGPEHFACQLEGIVFEIYPRKAEHQGSPPMRIGFRVPSVDAALRMIESGGGAVVSPPRDSPWGRRAVLTDPDGYQIEITST